MRQRLALDPGLQRRARPGVLPLPQVGLRGRRGPHARACRRRRRRRRASRPSAPRMRVGARRAASATPCVRSAASVARLLAATRIAAALQPIQRAGADAPRAAARAGRRSPARRPRPGRAGAPCAATNATADSPGAGLAQAPRGVPAPSRRRRRTSWRPRAARSRSATIASRIASPCAQQSAVTRAVRARRPAQVLVDEYASSCRSPSDARSSR